MQVLIKGIKREDLVSKQGKPWRSCNITVYSQSKQADVKLSGFGSDIADTWSIGDTVEVDIIDKENGYFDWRANANTKASPDKKLELLKRIDFKLDILLGKKDQKLAGSSIEVAQSFAKEFNGQVVSDLGNPVNPTEIKASEIDF